MFPYLNQHYKPGELIFVSDIDLPGAYASGTIRSKLQYLVITGKLKKFSRGIYYLPPASPVDSIDLTDDTIIKHKYMERKGRVEGYLSGDSFAEQLGLWGNKQHPKEITTNYTSSGSRTITIGTQEIVFKKPRTIITSDNYQALQFLDLLCEIDRYFNEDISELHYKIAHYTQVSKIKRKTVDRYISLYPDKVYKHFYNLKLYDVLE